jgi:hypothetical protein
MSRRETAVTKAYTAIFQDDPLLLDPDNWSKYRAVLLTHLLINRTVASCEPYNININSPTSRYNPEDQLPPNPPAPPADLINDYRRSTRHRDPIPDEARFDELKKVTMASDATFTEVRAKKKFMPHAQVPADLKKRRKSSKFEDRLCIAAVGYRVKISKLVDAGYLSEDLCPIPLSTDPQVTPLPDRPGMDQLRATRPLTDQNHFQNTILSHIGAALEQRPHFILLPEFALPQATAPSNTEKSIDAMICDAAAEKAKIDSFIFAGTRHEGKYNRGLVVSKAGTRVDPWWHYKVAPARKLGENILGPKGVRIPTYIKPLEIQGKEATVACAIAICYDAFDISMFLNLIDLSVKSGQSWDHLIILVPSFNTSPDFVAMLRDLSFLARCIVVYANGLHGDAKMFICGFSVSEIIDKRQAIIERAADMAEQLDNKLRKEEAQFTKRVSEDPSAQRTPVEEMQKSDWSDMRTALRRLRSALSELNRSGSLDHLITIEALPPNKRDRTSVTGSTLDDILYYNIDMGFLEALRSFRRQFFLGDKFLPKPLHYDELCRAFAKSAATPKARAFS